MRRFLRRAAGKTLLGLLAVPLAASLFPGAQADGLQAVMPEDVTAARISFLPASYALEQADQGAQIYRGACAICHGARLEGAYDVPPLNGMFVARWANTPLDRLFTYVTKAMPLMAPGSLSPQDNVVLLAFLLRENGVMPGNEPLPNDEETLARMVFPAPQLPRQ